MLHEQGLLMCDIMHMWVCDGEIWPMDAYVLKCASTHHKVDRTKEK
jgi:hypothetical protein